MAVFGKRSFTFKCVEICSNAVENRAANSVIYLDSSPACYTFPSTVSENPTNVICNDTGRYVTIRNPGSGPGESDILNICEVEVYGCSNGTYGLECNIDCNNCLHCNRWSGVCNEDCYPGWSGDYCNISCSTTTYGHNCNKKCSDRNCVDSTASCDPVTGSCECGPGWKGVDCREVCDREHYGPDCSGVCASRHCVAVSSCSRTTGQCDGGCQSRWTGIDCAEEQPTAVVDTSAVVAGTVTVVLGVLIIVVTVVIVVWRRRKGRSEQQNTSKHTASNTVVEVSEMRRKDTESPEGYDNLNDMSRDQSATYTEITSLDMVEDDIERVARDVTTGGVYEPVENNTYEKLNTPSRDTDGDYTDLQRKDSYVNVKRTGARSTD